jgi:hypothetical protein
MHPRTVAIIVGLILLGSFGMRWLIWHGGLFAVDEETMLKQATAIWVDYQFNGIYMRTGLTKAEDVQALLSTLHLVPMEREHFDDRGKVWGGITIAFQFADGRMHHMHMVNPTWLGRNRVDPRFYQTLCDLISREKGVRVQLLPGAP